MMNIKVGRRYHLGANLLFDMKNFFCDVDDWDKSDFATISPTPLSPSLPPQA